MAHAFSRKGSKVFASAFNKLGNANRAGALLASRGYQQLPAVSNRLLAGAGASRCVAQQFTTSTFASRSAIGDDAGGLLVDQMKLKIQEGLEAESVDVVDMSGDARHIGIKVVSKVFEGKNIINRQRLVYKCIWEEMQADKVHAVQAIETLTPDEK